MITSIMTTNAQQFKIYTIGHSNRSIEEFIELLKLNGVTLLADVRSIPKSRSNPQFHQDVFPQSLASSEIDYIWLNDLGGRRSKKSATQARAEVGISAPEANAYWQVPAFRNYADYAMGADFQKGFTRLKALATEQTLAIMCSEAVPWRCHRRIISDYLCADQLTPWEIVSRAEPKPHVINEAAIVHHEPWLHLTYPAPKSE